MKKGKEGRKDWIKCVAKSSLIFGIFLVICMPIVSVSLLYEDIPEQELTPSKAINNYELILQSNISFIITIFVDIPAKTNEGELSFYMDKDSQSDLFNLEKNKISSITILKPDRIYKSIHRNSTDFTNFFYNDLSIDFQISYIPNFEYYPLIFILYNGSWHSFPLDEPLKTPQKVIINENEIDKAERNNTQITNITFQVMGIGFTFIALPLPLKAYRDIKK